jgi:chromosome segregation ATPase
MKKKKSSLVSLIFSALLGLAAFTPSEAQDNAHGASSQPDTTQVLRELLEELRHLRRIVEHNNLYTFRAQFLFQRLRLQQERFDLISRRVEEAHNELTAIKAEEQRLLDNVKSLEEQMKQESDRIEYVRLESVYKGAKTSLEDQSVMREEQSKRENELYQQQQEDRSKLDALNAQLDSLERQIEAPQSVSEPTK